MNPKYNSAKSIWKCQNVKIACFHIFCSIAKLPAWRPKDTNVPLVSFLRLFSETILPKEFYFSKFMSNIAEIDEIQHPILWRNHQNWNLSFRNFLLKCETRINDKDLHDKEQKIYTNLFYFYLLKERSPKIISWIFNKRKLLTRSCKISRRDKY